jgi:hypothetical protein
MLTYAERLPQYLLSLQGDARDVAVYKQLARVYRTAGMHTSAFVSIRQHTSAYVSICQHT